MLLCIKKGKKITITEDRDLPSMKIQQLHAFIKFRVTSNEEHTAKLHQYQTIWLHLDILKIDCIPVTYRVIIKSFKQNIKCTAKQMIAILGSKT